jgi:hypothetical protein
MVGLSDRPPIIYITNLHASHRIILIALHCIDSRFPSTTTIYATSNSGFFCLAAEWLLDPQTR